jgi:hypothetical protein
MSKRARAGPMAIRDLSNNNEGNENSGKYLIDLNTGYQWSEEQKAYMRWLCLPKRRRKKLRSGVKVWEHLMIYRSPDNETELAEKLGVAYSTMRSWKNNPRWPDAMHKMSMLILIETEALVNQVKLKNMLQERGWQERLGYDRYSRDPLHELLRVGYMDEVKPGTATSTLAKSGTRDLALAKFAQLPPDMQQQLMSYLEELEVLEPEQGVTHPGHIVEAYAWDNEQDEDEDETEVEVIELSPQPTEEVVEQLSVTQRRNRRMIRPDEQDEDEEEGE